MKPLAILLFLAMELLAGYCWLTAVAGPIALGLTWSTGLASVVDGSWAARSTSWRR